LEQKYKKLFNNDRANPVNPIVLLHYFYTLKNFRRVQEKPTLLLTGGAGFLGSAILKELLDPGCPLDFKKIRVFDIAASPGITDSRLEWVTGDVRNQEAVLEACRGIDILIHTAAVVDWGTKPEAEVFAINTTGTENFIRACHAMKVKHLVYTSSLDAIFTGKPMVGIDESIPYPPTHENMYCKSKCEAEKAVLSTHPGILTTCVLRPSDIYGEGDPYHMGSLINMAEGGFYVRLGDGTAKSQHVYVGNAAWAHVLAARALWEGNPVIAGKAYFITDGPPTNFFKFFDAIVEAAGYPIWPASFWIPRPIAWAMGSIAEGFALLMRPFKHYNPAFSRFAVTYTCSDFTFTSARAARDFGFIPKYSEKEAFDLTVAYYKADREKKKNGNTLRS
jgi:nucleoside-diphosphate-sugar epimerase